MLRSLLSSLVAAALLLSMALSSSGAPVSFLDMASSWYRYREAVEYLQQKGSIGGYPDGTFRPKQTVNRAEFLKLVFRSRGTVEPVTGDCFADVKADAWFAPYVCAAARRGIVGGYLTPRGNTSALFRPEQPIVFAEAIKIVLRAYGHDVSEAKGEQWYEPYRSEIDRLGVLPRHSYIPWDPLTRERAADLIARFVRREDDRALLNLSPGCGKTAGDAPASVRVGDLERRFLLTVPQPYVPHDPYPLIIAYHGRTNSNDQVRSYMRLDRHAGEFFIAYPEALKNSNGTFFWDAGSEKGKDIAFFDALVEELGNRYCIDLDRVFTVGHSLGAWMANTVACIRGGAVRASATVGGDSLFTDCPAPAAAMIIHNPHDAQSAFTGAERLRDMRVRENACLAQSDSVQPDTLKCRLYRGCDGGNDVVFCPHEIDHDPQGTFYPHNWPREAGPTIVEFLRGLR